LEGYFRQKKGNKSLHSPRICYPKTAVTGKYKS